MYARLTESVLFVFQNNPKIPYTDAGIEIMKSALLNPLISWTKAPYNALSDAKEDFPFVSAPKALEVSAIDRVNRLLPDVSFSARYTGAIHKMVVTGTVSI